MTASILQFDTLDEDSLQVMQAYVSRAAAAKAAADEDFDGWLERVDTLQGLDADDLTRLHGQLIAMGFLKFEIRGRQVGLRYQISPRGKQAVDRTYARQATDTDSAPAEIAEIADVA